MQKRFIFIYHIEEIEGDTDTTSSQTEKMNEEPDTSTDAAENQSKNGIEKQEDYVSETKQADFNADDAKSIDADENGDNRNEQKSKDDNNTQDAESPIRLTLEEEESFHDDEVQLL